MILNRPSVRNALTPAHFERLGAVFEEVATEPGDRVMVLTGSGEAFCSGADLAGSRDVIQCLADGPVSRTQFARKLSPRP